MEILENIITSLDCILNTKRKRHITGGILLSASMLFSGFAVTVMTIKNDEDVSEKLENVTNEEENFYEFE